MIGTIGALAQNYAEVASNRALEPLKSQLKVEVKSALDRKNLPKCAMPKSV